MATPRRRTQLLTIDGEPFRWRGSRRAIMVEHAERDGARVREFLTLHEKVAEARIPHLVRHARDQGWDPTESGEVFEIAPASVWDDPRPRDYYQWMRVLRQQLHILEEFLGCPVEVGAYWWHGHPITEMGGLGARMRFGPCEMMPEADIWEAAYCITGTEGMKAYSDMFAFPFRGSTNLAIAERSTWRLWLKQDCEQTEGIWRQRGWQPWDADEWAYASEPGRVFHVLTPSEQQLSVAAGEPMVVRLSLQKALHSPGEISHALHFVAEDSRGTLLQYGTGDSWFPWSERPVREVDQTASTLQVEADILQHAVAGGWEPGRYRVQLRIRSENSLGEGYSEITRPISVVIS